MAAAAAARGWPTTLGTTGFVATRRETTRFTPLPGAAFVPESGLWLSTVPAGTVALVDSVTVPTCSPAACRAAVAAVCDPPTTFGTSAPSDTTSETLLPT